MATPSPISTSPGGFNWQDFLNQLFSGGVPALFGALPGLLEGLIVQAQLGTTGEDINLMQKLAKLGMEPGFLGNMAGSETQKLSPALTRELRQETQGIVGRMGWADSPALTNLAAAQVAAPYSLQEQQLGAQLAELGFQAPFNLPALYPQVGFGPGPSFAGGSGGSGSGGSPPTWWQNIVNQFFPPSSPPTGTP